MALREGSEGKESLKRSHTKENKGTEGSQQAMWHLGESGLSEAVKRTVTTWGGSLREEGGIRV